MSSLNSCNIEGLVESRCLFVKKAKYKPSQEYFGDYNCFFIKHKENDFIYNSGSGSSCENNKLIVSQIFDTVIPGNDLPIKTVKFSETCSFLDGEQPVHYYYTKGIGIIRKEYVDSNEVWNLVNYHIQL
jgi:hypothetical protein